MTAPPAPLKNYRVTINPDTDFAEGAAIHLQVEASNEHVNAMDQQRSWFRVYETPVQQGKDYRVSIDPDTDFAQGQVAYLQIEGENLYGNPMDAYKYWFRVVEVYPGYRVVINPDANFEEMTRVDLEIAAINADLLSMLEAFWFEIEHLDVVVSILPGYPDVGIISKTPGFDTSLIRWNVNKKVGTYQLEVGGTGKGTGIILGMAFGSQNVQGDLPGVLELIDTLIKGADLEVASPDSGEKRINVYVTDQWGYTNDYEG